MTDRATRRWWRDVVKERGLKFFAQAPTKIRPEACDKHGKPASAVFTAGTRTYGFEHEADWKSFLAETRGFGGHPCRNSLP